MQPYYDKIIRKLSFTNFNKSDFASIEFTLYISAKQCKGIDVQFATKIQSRGFGWVTNNVRALMSSWQPRYSHGFRLGSKQSWYRVT